MNIIMLIVRNLNKHKKQEVQEYYPFHLCMTDKYMHHIKFISWFMLKLVIQMDATFICDSNT